MAIKELKARRARMVAELLPHIESNTTYYARCSDCECTQSEWTNEALAAEWAIEHGWRMTGDRVLCPRCAPKYPASSLQLGATASAHQLNKIR